MFTPALRLSNLVDLSFEYQFFKHTEHNILFPTPLTFLQWAMATLARCFFQPFLFAVFFVVTFPSFKNITGKTSPQNTTSLLVLKVHLHLQYMLPFHDISFSTAIVGG